MRRRVLALTLVVTVLAACGADATSYAEKANAVCARVVAESRALFRQTGPARTARDRAFSRIVRNRGRALAELHKLIPPRNHRARVEQMLRHFDESHRLLRQGERTWGRSEEAPFLIVFASREGNKGHAVARELRLDDCAKF